MSAYDKWYNMISSIIDQKLSGGRRKRKPRPNVLATIDSNYSSGRPKVVMDDDPSQTPIGPYPYLAAYNPQPGDRVLLGKAGLKKYVILGKVI